MSFDIIEYAERYWKERIVTFNKDMDICLTPDGNQCHAYYPALLTAASFIELASCMYLGNLDPRGSGGKHVFEFCETFMPQPGYNRYHMWLFWNIFRHKSAHITQPYGVFDTATKNDWKNISGSNSDQKITWTVSELVEADPIAVKNEIGVVKIRSPWDSNYTQRCTISLGKLRDDIPQAVIGKNGYLDCLRQDGTRRSKFMDCIEMIFPR